MKRGFISLAAAIIGLAVLGVAVYEIVHIGKKGPDYSTEKGYIDISKISCIEIPEARKHVQAGYEAEVVEDAEIYTALKMYYADNLTQCLVDASAENDPTLKDCDKEWNDVENAHGKSEKDPTNNKTYDSYREAKSKWDACHADADKIHKKRTQNKEKERACHNEYKKSMDLAAELYKVKIAEAKTKFDADMKALDELEKRCAESLNKDSSNAGGGEEGGVVPKKKPRVTDIEKTACKDIPAVHRALSVQYDEDVALSKELLSDFKKILESKLASCLSNAKTEQEKARCQGLHEAEYADLLKAHQEDIQDIDTHFFSDKKKLDEVEKRCSVAKTESLMIPPAPPEKPKEVAHKKTVRVIDYKESLIPVAQLQTEVGPECDKEEHRHALNQGIAKTTEGKEIFDPGGCGFGKVKDTPVFEIEAGEQ